jgi:hypothetical protein
VAAITKAGQPRHSPRDGFLYPAIDGEQSGWPAPNAKLFRDGAINVVPTLIGSCDTDLGSQYAEGFAPANTPASGYRRYLAAVSDAVGLGAAFVTELEENYPLSRRNGSVHATLVDLIGDSNIVCTQHDTSVFIRAAASAAASTAASTAAASAAASTAPMAKAASVYEYSFEYHAAQSESQAFHASDLPFFWGDSGEFDTPARFTTGEIAVRDQMQRALLSFVADGAPNSNANWLQNSTDTMVFTLPTQAGPTARWRAERCALWKKQRTRTHHWLGDSELHQIFRNVSRGLP